MEPLLILLLGIIAGALLMYYIYSFFKSKRSKHKAQQQAVILLEKIKTVCKLITVEGTFVEVVQQEDIKKQFLGLISSKKKALIVVKAKVMVGFNLAKIHIEANPDKKQVVVSKLPEPEILSVEPDVEFYDITNGLFNKFESNDINQLNKQAVSLIREKVPNSSLTEIAKNEALEVIKLLQQVTQTIGWTLETKMIESSENNAQHIEN